MIKRPVGVLLLGFGGPDSLDAVAPFMENLMGRPPSPGLVQAVQARYRRIGGASPLPGTARRLAGKLEEHLNSNSAEMEPYVVRAGMCYWHPFIGDALGELAAAGVERVVAVSLSPHEARVTTGAYRRALETALGDGGIGVTFAPAWFDHPLFIDALAGELTGMLARVPAGEREGIEVVFTAHSLPAEHVRMGDPYVDQLRATAAAVAGQVGAAAWRLAFQSKGAGGGEWLAPTVEEVLAEYVAAGRRRMMVDPIGFVIDHMETLYDLDVLMRGEAEERDIAFHRCRCLNDSPGLVLTLAAVVRSSGQGRQS